MFALELQEFRNSWEGMAYCLGGMHYDAGDARGACQFLGGDAVIIRADEIKSSLKFDENGKRTIY